MTDEKPSLTWQQRRAARRRIARVKFRLSAEDADRAREGPVQFAKAAEKAGFDAFKEWPELMVTRSGKARCPHCKRIWRKRRENDD